MYGNLSMDENLVYGLPMKFLISSYTEEEAVSWTQMQQVASETTLDAMATCITKSGNTMSSDLIVDGNLVCCFLMIFLPSSYNGDGAVSWTQV